MYTSRLTQRLFTSLPLSPSPLMLLLLSCILVSLSSSGTIAQGSHGGVSQGGGHYSNGDHYPHEWKVKLSDNYYARRKLVDSKLMKPEELSNYEPPAAHTDGSNTGEALSYDDRAHDSTDDDYDNVTVENRSAFGDCEAGGVIPHTLDLDYYRRRYKNCPYIRRIVKNTQDYSPNMAPTHPYSYYRPSAPTHPYSYFTPSAPTHPYSYYKPSAPTHPYSYFTPSAPTHPYSYYTPSAPTQNYSPSNPTTQLPTPTKADPAQTPIAPAQAPTQASSPTPSEAPSTPTSSKKPTTKRPKNSNTCACFPPRRPTSIPIDKSQS